MSVKSKLNYPFAVGAHPPVGATSGRPNTSTNPPFGVLSGAFNAPLQWMRTLFISYISMGGYHLNIP